MKNLKKLLNGTGLVVLLCLMLSLFVSNTVQAQDNNGNVVTHYVHVDGQWGWLPDNCSAEDWPLVPAVITREWWDVKNFWHVTGFVQLPEGHCDIPEKGAVVTHYDRFNWSVINSNGKLMFKVRYHANDFR